MAKDRNTSSVAVGLASCAALLFGTCPTLRAESISVKFHGKVLDAGGAGVAGAKIELLESALTVLSDADGAFTLSGDFTLGAIRRSELPGGARLEMRGGRLTLWNPGLM